MGQIYGKNIIHKFYTKKHSKMHIINLFCYHRQAMTDLRKDLEKVRMLVDLVHRREKEKLKKTRLQVKYLETILFPLDFILRPVLEEIAA